MKATTKTATNEAANFRVYRLPKSLRLAVAKARAVTDQTVTKFVEQAVVRELNGLLGDVRVLFAGRHAGQKGPARLPLSNDTLDLLKKGSQLGVPASMLLELCLSRAAAKICSKARRSRKA
jgi:hypothetical protein